MGSLWTATVRLPIMAPLIMNMIHTLRQVPTEINPMEITGDMNIRHTKVRPTEISPMIVNSLKTNPMEIKVIPVRRLCTASIISGMTAGSGREKISAAHNLPRKMSPHPQTIGKRAERKDFGETEILPVKTEGKAAETFPCESTGLSVCPGGHE